MSSSKAHLEALRYLRERLKPARVAAEYEGPARGLPAFAEVVGLCTPDTPLNRALAKAGAEAEAARARALTARAREIQEPEGSSEALWNERELQQRRALSGTRAKCPPALAAYTRSRKWAQQLEEERARSRGGSPPDRHEDIDALAVPSERRPSKRAPVRKLLGYLIRLLLRKWAARLEKAK